MNNRTISIVISTFNGEKYICQLLDSIANQTINVTEVLISDDCSHDNTYQLIRDYIDMNDLRGWILTRNSTNQGWKENFFNLFKKSSGDYIFPCDQDDIWEHDKVEKMIQILDDNPDIDVLTSNYSIFYQSDSTEKSYALTANRMINDGSVTKTLFSEKWGYVLRPGCTFAFRRTFFEEIKNRWKTRYPHDALLWRYAIIKGSLANYNYPTIRFRRHSENASGHRSKNKQARINEVEYYYSFYQEMALYAQSMNKYYEEETIQSGMSWLDLRRRMLEGNKWLLFMLMVLKYNKKYSSYRGIIADLLFMLRRN